MPSFNLITKDINSGILDVFLEKMTWNHLEKEPKSLLELFPGFQVNLPSLYVPNPLSQTALSILYK